MDAEIRSHVSVDWLDDSLVLPRKFCRHDGYAEKSFVARSFAPLFFTPPHTAYAHVGYSASLCDSVT